MIKWDEIWEKYMTKGLTDIRTRVSGIRTRCDNQLHYRTSTLCATCGIWTWDLIHPLEWTNTPTQSKHWLKICPFTQIIIIYTSQNFTFHPPHTLHIVWQSPHSIVSYILWSMSYLFQHCGLSFTHITITGTYNTGEWHHDEDEQWQLATNLHP